MRPIPLMTGVAGLVTLLIAPMLHGQSETVTLQSLMDNRVLTARKAVGIVAGTVDATGVHIYSSGVTSIVNGAKPDGYTLFEIGSITKLFTSLLFADMIERGELKADDPVSQYLPGHAPAPSRDGKQITLLNLSMQNSGLPACPTT